MTLSLDGSSSREGVAVVSGGAQGIGRAVAEALATRGFSVATLDVRESPVHSPTSRSRSIAEYHCDLTSLDETLRVAEKLDNELGGWDVFVPNVGWSPDREYLQLSHNEVKHLIDVNLWSALNMTEAFLPRLVNQRYGRVCFIGSDAGRVGSAGQSIYAAAKAGVIGFAKSLALEVAQFGVTVNVVAPGTTDTAFLRSEYDEAEVKLRERANPTRRIGTPADVARAVAYLVDRDTSFVNGQVLSVNGGTLRI